MKKLVVIVCLVIAGMTANAQFYLGGSLDFSVSSTNNNDGDNLESTVGIGLFPELGFYLNDRFDLGLDFGFRVDVTNFETTNTDKTTSSWKFAPYARYSLFQFGGFELLAKGSASIGGSDDSKTKSTYLGVNISPILAYNLDSHFMLFTNLNFASFGYGSTFIKDGNSKHEFGFGVNGNKLTTLGNITVGCLYKF